MNEEDVQTTALQEYFDSNAPAGYGAAFRAGWAAAKKRIHEDTAVMRRFLMSAASDAHVFRHHQPHGSSFLDCDHTICQEHRTALGLPLHGRA